MQLLMLEPAQAVPLFLLAGFLFVVLGLARAGLGLGLARHPLFAGLLWWLIHGDAMPALPAAVFFELLWLDYFYVGTYIPPQALLSYLLFLPLALTFNLYYPQEVVLLLVLCLPFALLGARVELELRARFGGRGYEKLLQAFEIAPGGGAQARTDPSVQTAQVSQSVQAVQSSAGGCAAQAQTVQTVLGGLIRSAVLVRVLSGLTLYGVSALLLFGVVWVLGVSFGVWPVGVMLDIPVAQADPALETWGVYWVLAAIGGLLALRIRWALACFVAGALAMGIFLLF